MKRFFAILTGLVSLAFLLSTGIAQEKAQYVGNAKCKTCHKSEKRGDQMTKWENSAHAKAFATLGSPESKAIAQKAGISGDPQKAGECLVCHIAGYGEPKEMFDTTYKQEEGVSCEACHGAGSLYKSMKVMKDLTAGTIKPESVGLKDAGEKTCLTCHNEKSPTYKPFKFAEAYAKIKHETPK